MIVYVAFSFYDDIGKRAPKIDYLIIPLIVFPLTAAILLLVYDIIDIAPLLMQRLAVHGRTGAHLLWLSSSVISISGDPLSLF
jgi:hypothetical protein